MFDDDLPPMPSIGSRFMIRGAASAPRQRLAFAATAQRLDARTHRRLLSNRAHSIIYRNIINTNTVDRGVAATRSGNCSMHPGSSWPESRPGRNSACLKVSQF